MDGGVSLAGVCGGGGVDGRPRSGVRYTGMSRERTKSRPVSFRVPVEDWAALVSAADAGGESVGLYAARVVREAVENQTDTPRYTGRWGVEAAMPPERDDLPTTPLLRRAFGGISTQSDETADEGAAILGETPADTPEMPYTATESAETGEIGADPARSARIAALLAVTDP